MEQRLKDLWEGYLNNSETPQLAEQPLSDLGLVVETLHFIAPGSFTSPTGPQLNSEQESLLYWLKSQYSTMTSKIDEKSLGYLHRELDDILRINLTRQ